MLHHKTNLSKDWVFRHTGSVIYFSLSTRKNKACPIWREVPTPQNISTDEPRHAHAAQLVDEKFDVLARALRFNKAPENILLILKKKKRLNRILELRNLEVQTIFNKVYGVYCEHVGNSSCSIQFIVALAQQLNASLHLAEVLVALIVSSYKFWPHIKSKICG